MRCDICGRMIDHDPRCPNYLPRKAAYLCSSCGEGIYEGEEYIENIDGECRHYECFSSMRDLIEWLGFEIKIMEENIE